MYLRHVKVENWRMLDRVVWDLGPHRKGSWHVIVGPNGSGKSTLLRAICLAMLGTDLAERMEPRIKAHLGDGASEAVVALRAVGRSPYDRKRGGAAEKETEVAFGLRIRDVRGSLELAKAPRSDKDLDRSVWSPDGDVGWYAAAIGSNRRFRGNDTSLLGYFGEQRKIVRSITLFYEAVSFQAAADWIRSLDDGTSHSYDPSLLKRIASLLNAPGLLPFGVQAVRLGKENVFRAPDGAEVDLDAMSEGFKSLFAIVFEVLRGMAEVYGARRLFKGEETSVAAPGLVLVDEIDSHLHPEWQREIGGALTSAFPNVQWIVTTHSPFVAQHAISGTILKLPDPDEDEEATVLKGEEYRKAVYGDVTDSLDSLAFEVGQTRSDEAQALLGELAEINVAARRRRLDHEERTRRAELLSLFPEVAQRIEGASQ